MQIRKNKKAMALPAADTKQSVEKQLAWAAGAERLRQHDPLYYVTENFHQSFDRMGRAHALAAAGGFQTDEKQKRAEPAEGERDESRKKKQNAALTAGQSKDSARLMSLDPSAYLTRFSEIAFQRGAMSASVLNGTGKMMLVSCLRRTQEEMGPKHLQQQDLLRTGSQVRNIGGHAPDKMVFNRGFSKSALGVVVDTIRDARRMVESMEAMAAGANELTNDNSAAMYKLYPFLDDSRDAQLEAEYRNKLAQCTDDREKPVLQNALVQTASLRAKKAQMKNEFINKLRFISDRATETLYELETPGFLEELTAAAFGGRELDLPENPDDGADGDAPNRKKNGSNQTKREENPEDATEAKP